MAQMTGSGAAVFGIFDDESAARSAVAALKNGYKQVYLCKPTRRRPPRDGPPPVWSKKIML